MCMRWNADRANMSEGTWSGSVNSCTVGDMDASWRDRSLRLVNLYRWLGELDPVTTDPVRNQKAQACALVQEANPGLNHHPPMSATCFSQDGYDGSSSSNISTGPAVMSVDLYMVDPGNLTTMGHRRWIMANNFGPTGIGSTDGASCLWTLGGQPNGNNAFTAFPTPGPFPIEAMTPLPWGAEYTVDYNGWTVQAYNQDVRGASVTVTSGGQNMPVQVRDLSGNYGGAPAIAFTPNGWTTEAGKSYHVELTGITTPISYDVHMVDCG